MGTYSSEGAGKTLDTLQAAAQHLTGNEPVGTRSTFTVPSAKASPGGSKPAAKKAARPPTSGKK